MNKPQNSTPVNSENKHYPPAPSKQNITKDKLLALNDHDQKYYIVPVYYGTDRVRTKSKNLKNIYGGDRNIENKIEYGIVNVAIPFRHEIGKIELPHWWKPWDKNDTSKYFQITDIKFLESEIFFQQLKDIINSSTNKDAFIFIHGYNNSFNDAAFRTAQLAFDLGFKGAPIFYSWPSKGKPAQYIADENDNEWTIPHLKKFIVDIVNKTHSQKVNIIAHSMGNRALVKALKDIELENKDVKFNQIILAAPDIDASIFKRDIAPKIVTTAERITIYSSSNDKALALSKDIHHYRRAGESGSDISSIKGIETIDASKLNTDDLLQHSYFAQSGSIISDMFLLLNYNLPPDGRNLLLVNRNDTTTYWTFKN
jgi:esterase/lipase superfamily enzyme